MNFEFFELSNGYIEVFKEKDGGCGSFKVAFPTMEQAQDFVIRILVNNGDLPRTMEV